MLGSTGQCWSPVPQRKSSSLILFKHFSRNMGENDDEKYSQAGQIFENFVQASTCKGTIQAFNILTRQLELDPLDNRNFYTKLKSRVTTWKAKALWNKLDKRASHKEYKRGKSCMNTKVSGVQFWRSSLRILYTPFSAEERFLPFATCAVSVRVTLPLTYFMELWLVSADSDKFSGVFVLQVLGKHTAHKNDPKSSLLYSLPQSWHQRRSGVRCKVMRQ